MDNLKLGYGGTKQEMERLLADASKLSGKDFLWGEDGMGYGYAEIVEAIHVMQTEMHISGLTAEEAAEAVASGAMTEEEAFEAMGTTAKEASTTIQGSLASMKGAWQNLLTGVADDNANFDVLVSNFVDSLVTAGENIIPRINIVIQGLTQLITEASQTIIPLAVETLLQNLPAIVAAGMDLIMALVNGILDNIDMIIDCAIELIDVVVNKLIENLPKLIDGGIRLIIALGIGLIEAIPQLVSKIPEIIVAIIEGFASGASKILDIGKNIVEGVWQGIKNAAKWLKDKVFGFFDGIIGGVKDFLGIHSPSRVFADMGKNMALGIGEGWDNQYDSIKKDIESGMNFTASVSTTGKVPKIAGSMTAQAQNYVLDALKNINFSIYLDGKTLVGKLAPTIDEQMGTLHIARARGV